MFQTTNQLVAEKSPWLLHPPKKNNGNIFKTWQPSIFELLSNLHGKYFDDVPVIIESFLSICFQKNNPIAMTIS